MELYKEILLNILKKEKINITFPDLNINSKGIIEIECYKALQQIKNVIEDDNLSDKECFLKIEKIICIFESIGSDCGNRHDFG